MSIINQVQLETISHSVNRDIWNFCNSVSSPDIPNIRNLLGCRSDIAATASFLNFRAEVSDCQYTGNSSPIARHAAHLTDALPGERLSRLQTGREDGCLDSIAPWTVHRGKPPAVSYKCGLQ